MLPEIPSEWHNKGVSVALTSDEEQFEDVGRSLLSYQRPWETHKGR